LVCFDMLIFFALDYKFEVARNKTMSRRSFMYIALVN